MNIKKSNFRPINSRYLFLDMDSFFASCEQQFNPKWQNRPLIVAPHTGPTGCAIAVSREAKRLGVKTGMLVKDAQAIVPNIIIAPSRTDIYRKTHQDILRIVNQFSPWVEVKSIDEMAIPLAPSERMGERPSDIGLAIKKAFLDQLGSFLTCSVGIGPNIFLAKQAAKYTKPNGLTIIEQSTIPEYLKKMSLMDLTGIGKKMLIRLGSINILTPMDFYESSPEHLRTKLGISGEYWYLRLHGYPIEYLADKPNKSISQSCVLAPSDRNWANAKNVLHKLVIRAGLRLREGNFCAKEIGLSIGYLGQSNLYRHKTVHQFQDDFTFFKHMDDFWQDVPKINMPYKIAVYTTKLIPDKASQLDLFNPPAKETHLTKAIDKINSRLGKYTVHPASLLQAERAAPERISFGKPN